jgi:hypothetical protein
MDYPRYCVAVKQSGIYYPVSLIEPILTEDAYQKMILILDDIADEYEAQLQLVLMVPTESLDETERQINHNLLCMPDLAELADYIFAELHV